MSSFSGSAWSVSKVSAVIADTVWYIVCIIALMTCLHLQVLQRTLFKTLVGLLLQTHLNWTKTSHSISVEISVRLYLVLSYHVVGYFSKQVLVYISNHGDKNLLGSVIAWYIHYVVILKSNMCAYSIRISLFLR